MTNQQILDALHNTEARIIGMKKHARKMYGASQGARVPEAFTAKMDELREQCRQYRVMLDGDRDG